MGIHCIRAPHRLLKSCDTPAATKNVRIKIVLLNIQKREEVFLSLSLGNQDQIRIIKSNYLPLKL